MGQLTFQATLGGSVNLAGPNTASTTTFTLPAADGTSGQFLSTNGSGTLSFASVAASQWTTSGSTIYYTGGAVFVGASSVISLENFGVTYSSNTNYGLGINDSVGNNGATSIAFYSAGVLKGSIAYNGTATTFKTSASGVQLNDSGVTFPATQVPSADANTLDDYEEGTWTPTVTINSGTATAYTINTATYTKTGRMVVLLGSIIPTNGTFGSAGGYIRLTGLPFVPSGRVGVGSGGNSSNLNNGVSTTFAYMLSVPTIDATFESSVTNANEWAFISTFFV